jgi:hypothetical protein
MGEKTKRRTRDERKQIQRSLVAAGFSRATARRAVWGNDRNEMLADGRERSRGATQNAAIAHNASKRRWRRRQAVAASLATAEAAF